MTGRVLGPFCSRNQEVTAVILLQSAALSAYSASGDEGQQRGTGPCLIFCLTWLGPAGLLLGPPIPGTPLAKLTPQAEGYSAVVFPLQERHAAIIQQQEQLKAQSIQLHGLTFKIENKG